MKLTSIILAIAVAGLAAAQNDDPWPASRARSKDPAKPFSLVVEFTLKPGSAPAVKSLMATAVQKTREEAGNPRTPVTRTLRTQTLSSSLNSGRVYKALEYHVTESYTKALVEKLTELSTEPMKVRVLYPFVPEPTLGKRAVVRPTPR